MSMLEANRHNNCEKTKENELISQILMYKVVILSGTSLDGSSVSDIKGGLSLAISGVRELSGVVHVSFRALVCMIGIVLITSLRSSNASCSSMRTSNSSFSSLVLTDSQRSVNCEINLCLTKSEVSSLTLRYLRAS